MKDLQASTNIVTQDQEDDTSSTLDMPDSPPAGPSFLNVAHMVRQSSDTTNNRNRGTRQLTRSSAFDEFIKQAVERTEDVEDGELNRPATSQCINSDDVPSKMPYHSPYLRRPTRLTKKVTLIHSEATEVNLERSSTFSEGEAGYIQLNQYRLIEEIGQGSYGIVKLAYNEQDKNLYAMKVVDKLKLVKNFACFRPPPIRKKDSGTSGKSNQNVIDGQLSVHRNPLQLVQREIAILKKLSHPNVVKLVEVLDDPDDNYLYMVFEYVERRSLLELPTDNPLAEHDAWKYFRDTLKGLEYLHYQKIVHRDLKPSNLLHTESGAVKIADFGVSCEFEGIDAFLTGTAGSPAFMAPEALTENSSQFYSGRAQDLWSLGVTLYSLVFGTVPFWHQYVIALYKKIKTEPLKFPEHIMISDLLKGLITEILQKDPGHRLRLDEIKEHNWVTRNGFKTQMRIKNNGRILQAIHFSKVPMPTDEENCSLVTVTEEEIRNCVRVIPRLDTLILVKAMGRKKHFGNPFRSNGIHEMVSRRKSSSLREQHSLSYSVQQQQSPPPASARPWLSSNSNGDEDQKKHLETLSEQFDTFSVTCACNGSVTAPK